MNKITERCTGCRACEQLCKKNAISMIADKEGFLQAVINPDNCIDCNLCANRCPQNAIVPKHEPQKVIAARYTDDKLLYNSASGGAFIGIALAVIQNGGVVFGVCYDTKWNAVHVLATTKEELEKIQSSKYVQADTLETYSVAKKYLDSGKFVLYSGTGCQIAGLKAFLNHKYDNLLTIDLICHGVSSPLLFRNYIDWLSRKYEGKILFYNFRDKTGGWGLGYKTKTKTKTKTKPSTLDPYYYHFLKGNVYRECCYQCKYCTKERVGDITIGDYWGIEREHPKFFSTKGVSVVLLNTRNGMIFFDECERLFHVCESSFDKAAKMNGNLVSPTHRPQIRDSIYEHIEDEDYFETVLAYPKSVKAFIKDLIPMKVLFFMKKIQGCCINLRKD